MTDKGFEINGTLYEIPMPSTFDMDEAEIFYDYTGFVVESIWLEDLGWSDLGKRPGFLTSLVHIAYRRGNPDVANSEIRAMVGKLNRVMLFGAMLGSLTPDEPVSEDPKAAGDDGTSSSPISSETGSTQNGTRSTPDHSGKTSKPSSVPPVVAHGTTGTHESERRSTPVPLKQVV